MRRFPLHLTLCAFLTAAPAAFAGPLDTTPACDGEKKPKDGTGNPDKAFAGPACDGEKKPKDGTGNPDKA